MVLCSFVLWFCTGRCVLLGEIAVTSGRNLYLPRASPYAARIVKPAPERGIMARGKLMFAEKRREHELAEIQDAMMDPGR